MTGSTRPHSPRAWLSIPLLAACAAGAALASGIDGGYVGTQACLSCHNGTTASDKTSFLFTGHPYKLRMTGGAVPTPAGDPLSALLIPTMPRLVDLLDPNGEANVKVDDGSGRLDWSAVSYVIGGWGWKARWGVRDGVDNSATGYIWSSTVSSPTAAQFNMLAADPQLDPMGRRADWSSYGSATKKYNCATCHNTNGTDSTDTGCATPLGSGRTEPWASTGLTPAGPGGFRSEWSFSGVQCEGCHGPGSNGTSSGHADLGASVTQGVLTMPGGGEYCANCHIRGENVSAAYTECGGSANANILLYGAKISGSYIQHHEQWNELKGVNNDGVHNTLGCTTCHDPHERSHKVTDAIASALGIPDNDSSAQKRGAVVSCQSAACHATLGALRIPMAGVTCVDCHMAEATKSATNESPDGTWGRMGDVKTHIFRIDPSQTSITRTNPAGVSVATNYLTAAYACGKCHDASMGSYVGFPLTLAQAQDFAINIHEPPPPTYFTTFSFTTAGLTVAVDAQVSCGGTCPALTYDWNWGDGTAHGTADPDSHTYATAGTKQITLLVKLASNGDTVGSVSRKVILTETALPPAPDGTFAFDANTWIATFVDASTDPNGNIGNVLIAWGDGVTSGGHQGGTFTHAYTWAQPGGFNVSQTVCDTTGLCASRTWGPATPTTFFIGGTVKNRLGTLALGGAAVTVTKIGFAKTVTTAIDGTFTVAGLKPGTYNVKVSKFGYTFANPAAVLTLGPDSAGNIILATAP